MIRNETFQEDELRELADLTTNVRHFFHHIFYASTYSQSILFAVTLPNQL